MRIKYYPDTDSLYVYLVDCVSSETHVISDGIQADFDLKGSLIGVEIEHVDFYANSSAFSEALSNLSENVTIEEKSQISQAFEHILAGVHKQSDLIA